MSIRDLNQYEIIKDEVLQDVKCHGYLLKHKISGAKLVLMEADDDNKVFSVGFRTPPEDSTGLPHILEHSVLCGSDHLSGEVGSNNSIFTSPTFRKAVLTF